MDKEKQLKGIVFDIQGLSVHDGPGCRTTIFLKGCSLKCSWCSNPEGINPFIEPLYNTSKCINDKNCIEACGSDAISLNNNRLHINKSACKECKEFSCVRECYTDALKLAGYYISIDDIFRIIQRDRQFWGAEGGITLSGGEPFFQPEFSFEILKRCHDSYIHTAVETCGNINWKFIERCLPYVDWIYFDIKHLDKNKHFEQTKTNNNLILSNAKKLAEHFTGRLIFRIPVISGYNDSDEHINRLADFLIGIGKEEINILPLHRLGREKYKLLGFKEYPSIYDQIPNGDDMLRISEIFKSRNIRCYTGSDTPF